MMAPGTSAMLRARRKDNNYKANRKLDRKSSRGMLYENEELRLRTININAEVERGQSDIKKLQRENQQLKREIWGLREEYDKLESIVRRQGSTDNEESLDEEDREYEEEEEDEEEEEEDNAQNQEKVTSPPHKTAVGVQFDGLSVVDEETERDITPENGANGLPLYVNLVPPQHQQPFFGKITLPSGKEGVFVSDSSAVPPKVRREGRVDAPLITIDGSNECGREDDEDGYFGIPGESFRRGGPDLLLVPAAPRPRSPTPSMLLEELIKYRSGRPEDTTHVVVTDYAAEGGILEVVSGGEYSSDTPNVEEQAVIENGGQKSAAEDSNQTSAAMEDSIPGNSKVSISGEHSNKDGLGRYRSQLSVTLRQPGASSLENLLQEKHPQERLNTSLPDIGVASSGMYLRTPPCTPAACVESPLSRPETPAQAFAQAPLKSPLNQLKGAPQGASGRPHTPFPTSTVPIPKKSDYHAIGQAHRTNTPPNIFFSKIPHSSTPQHKLPQQAFSVNNIMNESTESGGETGYFSLFSPTETPANNPFSNVFPRSPPDHSLNPFSSPVTPHVAYPADGGTYMLIPQQGAPNMPYYVRPASPYQPPVPGFIPYEAAPTLLPLSQLQPAEQMFQQYFPGTPAVPATTLLAPPSVVPSPKVSTNSIPQSRNLVSNESADDEAESPATMKAKVPNSPKLTRKSTKKLQQQVSTRTSSGDEGTASSPNMILRKPRKVSSSSHDEPNATSSPTSKHRSTVRKTSNNDGGGTGSAVPEPPVASSDLSHSSTSGQESPSKQRRRVSIYFNNNNNKAPSKRRDTVSVSSIPGRGILTRSNSPEFSRHERERSHSVSSSVRTNGSATSGRLRRHSGSSTTDAGKVPWCACWGNGCI